MSVVFKIIIGVLSMILAGGLIAGIIDVIKNRKSKHKPAGIYEAFFKRVIDFICGMLVIVILWPLYIVLAVMVRIKLGSPVLFTQERPGKDEKIFKLYKFRTMTDERDENGKLLPDDKRITSFGLWLRRTSMDEIPEAFNIIRGEMSIVGPRPQLVRDMVFMSDIQRQRHVVRQGLTGLAQVNGRNSITWEEKIAFDLKYIEKIKFLDDVSLIFKTVGKVLKRADINRAGTVSDMDYGDYLLQKGTISKEEYDKRQKEAKEI